MTGVLDIQDLTFAYGRQTALDGVSFRLGGREILGIIGPNGAGKTTLLKLVLGLLKPQKGRLNVFGQEPSRTRGRIGYVPQHPQLDAAFPITAREVVEMGLLSRARLFRAPGREEKKRIDHVLEEVGMTALAGRHIAHLSGGEFQRILLARALVSGAELLILDEPFASIDAPSGLGFYELLKKWRGERTIILVSHDIGVIPHYVDKLCCLNKKLFHFESKEEALKNLHKVYGCAVDVIAHGIPHRVLDEHKRDK